MDYGSPVSMCLPSKRGRGRCAYIMVEHLIEKQNEIVQLCRDEIKSRPRQISGFLLSRIIVKLFKLKQPFKGLTVKVFIDINMSKNLQTDIYCTKKGILTG